MEPILFLSLQKSEGAIPAPKQDVAEFVGAVGSPPTKAGLFILAAYARSVVGGSPNADMEMAFANTALDSFMRRMRVNGLVAEFWAR